MKYYYKKPENWVGAGIVYSCDHQLYNQCTLFRIGEKGIAVIQEHFHPIKKTRWWGPIEPWIAGDIYLNAGFKAFFDENAEAPDEKGIFPTFPVRKVMWVLRMKPLKKACWETERWT